MTTTQTPGRGVADVETPREERRGPGLPMSEDDLLGAVLDLCRVLHLRTLHIRPAWTDKGWRTPVSGDGKGFPDLLIVGNRVIVRELKAERGRLTPEQAAWLAVLYGAGVDAMTWRPSDWRSGRVMRELKALTEVPDA